VGLVLKGAPFIGCRAPEHRSKTNVRAPPDFPAYAALADALIERATKDQLADVARLLALNIGWYPQRYGDVPQEALLKMVRAETLHDETLALLSAGMQNLVSALAEVTGLNDDLEDEPRH
jgi:hypothetical protein